MSNNVDEIVLNFNCLGNCVDLMIDDIDKVMWIDLINEFEDEFRKNNYQMPEFPSFHYCFKQKAVKIHSDKDLMTMLQRFSNSKVVYIHVGFLDKLTECVKLARNLKLSVGLGKDKNVLYETTQPRTGSGVETGSDDPKTVTSPIPKDDHFPTVDNDVMDRLNHANEETAVDVENYLDEHPEFRKALNKKPKKPKKLPLRTNRKRQVATPEVTVLSQMASFSNAPPSLHAHIPTQPAIESTASVFLKKIPRTTAARKGLMIQHVSQPLQQPEVELHGLEDLGNLTLERDVGGRTVNGREDPLDDHEYVLYCSYVFATALFTVRYWMNFIKL
ncbi:hypothetical protein BVRB_7g164240 [Beta vulgaris subsp. vulgaris]|nr:hypothetical protein BVRB_7g164240 [Beta vulgaris subsp. vulgaris]